MAGAQQKRKGLYTSLAELLAPNFPELKKKLKLADMPDDTMVFLEKVVASTILISAGLLVLVYIFLYSMITQSLVQPGANLGGAAALIVLPLLLVPVVIFFYLMLYPDAALGRRQKEMDYEIVFAGRHLAIALKAGMPLFDTFAGTSTGYGAVSREFGKIVDKVVMGVPMTQAIREVASDNPSKYFSRIMVQIANALSSGADVGSSLESVLEQISKEQLIALKEYSQKLTPLVMFYMIFGIIVPSLGIVLATVVFSAISGGQTGFSAGLLAIVFLIIGLIQFLFLGFIEASRPRYLI